jgi:hypothetical protein
MHANSALRRGAQRLWRDSRAQDFIEYALLSGFIAGSASALQAPFVAGLLKTLWGRITELLVMGAGS